MLPPQKKKVICKISIIPEASSVPHGSIEEKTKKPRKMSQYRPLKKKKKKIQYQWKSDESTLILDFKLKKT